MNKIKIKEFYEIYKIRKEMQELGITNPPEYIKQFTKDVVKKLSEYHEDEIISLVDLKLFDSKGELIIDLKIKN